MPRELHPGPDSQGNGLPPGAGAAKPGDLDTSYLQPEIDRTATQFRDAGVAPPAYEMLALLRSMHAHLDMLDDKLDALLRFVTKPLP